MKLCSYCGRQNPDEAPLCFECGSRLEEPLPSPPSLFASSDSKRVANLLLSARNRKTTWQAFLQIELRSLPLKLLPLCIALTAFFLKWLSWEFTAGLILAFILGELVFWKLFSSRWPLLKESIDWVRIDSALEQPKKVGPDLPAD